VASATLELVDWHEMTSRIVFAHQRRLVIADVEQSIVTLSA
jgi:hypothetical protein